MSKGLIVAIFVGVIFITGVAFSFITKGNDIKKIKSNPKQTVCKVVDHDIPKKSSDTHYGVWIRYEYEVNGSVYKHLRKYYFPKDDEQYFVGLSFPLIYCADDPDVNRILILKENFDEFDLPQPDSLKQYNGKIF
ncbi:MAG: hypothetical protein K0S53_1234 [Bacteroidetes bacterium]|jgi:hypothetical protein|nr:hypothetical protein [Bacteroidota bacterium]MDF2452300.1 hypothetical protein [Bacteroidota bacterium]